MSLITNLIYNVRDWTARKLKPDEFAFMPQPEWGWGRGLLKSWDDPAYAIDVKAYQTLLRQDAVQQPMHKFADRLSGMRLTVVGKGKRRDELQKIVSSASGVGDMLYWMAFAKIEGARFVRNRFRFDPRTEYYVPDFRGCGARKWKAGGNIYWKGWHGDMDNPKKSIGKVEEVSNGDPGEQMDAKGVWYDRSEWTVFRPGAGANPEGETDVTLMLWRLARMGQHLDKAMEIYADRYSLPREIVEPMLKMLRPDEMSARLTSAANKIKKSDARQRMVKSPETLLKLMEPQGATWEFLTEYRKLIERRAHKLIFGEDLSSGGQESGDRGGRDQSEKQLWASLSSFGAKLADALSDDWLQRLQEVNEDQLPRLKKGEPEPYLELRPVVGKERLTIAELNTIGMLKIPMYADDVYQTIGKDKPEEAPDVFEWDVADPVDAVPSNTGDAFQRGDRKQDDSGDIGPDDTRKQNPSEDQRNVEKEDDED